jgi:hypothetical protein
LKLSFEALIGLTILMLLMILVRYKAPKEKNNLIFYSMVFVESSLFWTMLILSYTLGANDTEYDLYIVLLLSPLYSASFILILKRRHQTLINGTMPSTLPNLKDVIIF